MKASLVKCAEANFSKKKEFTMEIDDIPPYEREELEAHKKSVEAKNQIKNLIILVFLFFCAVCGVFFFITSTTGRDKLNSLDSGVSEKDKYYARVQSERILEPILTREFGYVNFQHEFCALQNFENGMWVYLGKFRGPRENWGRITGGYRFEFVDNGKGDAFITGINCVWLENGKEKTATIYQRNKKDYHYWFKEAESRYKNNRQNKLSKIDLRI